jgi:hypothetical protein
MVICACGLLPNPAKVLNFQYRAWLCSMDQKFHGDDKKNPRISKLRIRLMANGHNFLFISASPWNFWSIEHNHALYWKFGTLAGLESRPQAQMTMSSVQNIFMVLRPFEGALTCSVLIAETKVMPRKAYFHRRGSWLRPESWTPRPRIPNPGPYYLGAHTNGLMFKISAL